LLRPRESSNNGSAFKSPINLLRYGVTMPRSSSALLSTPKLSTTNFSTLILCTLIFCTIFSASAFAQGLGKRMLPAEGNDRDQQKRRAQWNMRGREAPKGESAAALRLRAHRQKMAMRTQREAAARAAGAVFSPQVTTWLNLGPAPLASDATGNGSQDYNWVSGRATSVLVDPADTTGNTILLGGAYGGLWKSTNAGSKSATPNLVTWQALIDDQPSLAVGAIALQPGNSNLILVGTGETNASGDSYYGMGILRSTNGGATWTQITSAASSQSFVGVGFSKIAFSTSNTNLVVASTAGDIGFDFGLEQDAVSTARGLYYSIDAGATWNRVTLSDNAVPASATGVVYNATQGAFYAAIRRHGIYSSTDGQHFTRLATQPTAGLTSANCPAGSNSANCPIYRAEFAVTPARNEMYVWVFDLSPTTGETDDGIWRTTNGGSAWTQIPDNGITNCGSGGGGEGPGGSGSGCGVEQGAYNLEIAAIPDSAGTGTDLYAGTINIHKCHLASGASSCSTIDTNVPTDWINLTHVYGCPVLGELAHVHPDQHGLGFLVVGSMAPGYFAHDGGISRTLDGYADLKSGTCTTPNLFDSLSQTLGSMTEFVSFSVHPTSADILLGGTQDNGSPKTGTGTTSTIWQNALGGDGGFNAINPNNTSEWFTSNPGSVIWICDVGTGCDDNGAFLEAAPPIPGFFAGNIDFGAFYTPFILDPQSTDEMLIGTCRVWRGSTNTTPPESPGVFNQLSVNFDTLNTTLCSGSEINQVAGITAGGPKDANGLSNVVFATTWGYGPLANIGGGEVWVTTNAGAATPVMTNVTGSINPKNYAISSVAIDTSVANGQTAFVGIMGFHTSHVWKTTNAGTGWTDWTGTGLTSLPDAPVSALLVDPATGIIYAGTDVGVFSSPTTGGGVWTEVGPVAGPGSGFLPSAPVTAIQIFNNGTTKDLRVSTYGRGIWEFSLPAGSTTTTVTSSLNPANFGASVTFTATVTTTGAIPPTGTVTFNDGTTAIGTGTLNTVGGLQVATFATSTLTVGTHSITAVYGGDANNAGSTSSVLSQVIAPTFTLSTPTTPAPALSGQSANSTFTVTATGGATTFAAAVTFACNNLPDTTVSCAFSTVAQGATSPQTVTLTIATSGPNSGTVKPQQRRAENRSPWLPLTLPLAGIVMVGFARRKMSRGATVAGMCLMLVLAGFLIACGSSSPVSITSVTGSSSSIFPQNTGWTNATATFTAVLANDSGNKGVTWAVTTANGGSIVSADPTHGTYTPPTIAVGLPTNVTITATAVADTSKTGTASISLKPTTVPGSYQLTVTATEGPTQNTTPQFTLTVK
jgi:large repetitive protein